MKQIEGQHGTDSIGVAKLGEIFAQSGYFRDVRDQAQAVVKILYGRELGFSPVVSMMGIHVIEGKPSLSSNLLGTLVKRSGKYDYRVIEATDLVVKLEFFVCETGKRESLGFAEFSIEDAKRANLLKPGSGWMKYPKAMLFARALSAGVRLHCPDVSACPLYVPEELGATVTEDGEVTELPKSARPVAVTTEDIDLGPAPSGGGAEPLVKGDAPPQADTPAVIAGDFIDQGQAVNFERTFKDALKPHLRKNAAQLAHDWLLAQGIVDADGKPTAKAIRKDNYYDVREAAVTHAASLQ